jgi:hypothetical protein
MPVRSDPARHLFLAVATAALVVGCAGGAPSPAAWTPVPSAPAATAAAPSGSPTSSPSSVGLTDQEFAGLTTAWGISKATVDSPQSVSAVEAEQIVRERYPGDRPLVWSGLVAYGDAPRLGWMVVLGTAPGQACALHPGLLERAFEGRIVDAASGDIFFTMTCG